MATTEADGKTWGDRKAGWLTGLPCPRLSAARRVSIMGHSRSHATLPAPAMCEVLRSDRNVARRVPGSYRGPFPFVATDNGYTRCAPFDFRREMAKRANLLVLRSEAPGSKLVAREKLAICGLFLYHCSLQPMKCMGPHILC